MATNCIQPCNSMRRGDVLFVSGHEGDKMIADIVFYMDCAGGVLYLIALAYIIYHAWNAPEDFNSEEEMNKRISEKLLRGEL